MFHKKQQTCHLTLCEPNDIAKSNRLLNGFGCDMRTVCWCHLRIFDTIPALISDIFFYIVLPTIPNILIGNFKSSQVLIISSAQPRTTSAIVFPSVSALGVLLFLPFSVLIPSFDVYSRDFYCGICVHRQWQTAAIDEWMKKKKGKWVCVCVKQTVFDVIVWFTVCAMVMFVMSDFNRFPSVPQHRILTSEMVYIFILFALLVSPTAFPSVLEIPLPLSLCSLICTVCNRNECIVLSMHLNLISHFLFGFVSGIQFVAFAHFTFRS